MRVRGAYSDERQAASKGDATLDVLSAMFGPPVNAVEYRPSAQQRFESWSLRQAYEGKVRYLATTISTLVRQSHNSFVTRYIFPLREEHEMTFTAQRYIDDRGLAPQTAPGAPAEYVTSGLDQATFRMQRYALATIMSTEALKSPQGKTVFLRNLTNVGMTFADTMEQLALNEMTRRKMVLRERNRLNDHSHYQNIEDVWAVEVSNFGGVQKGDRGFYVQSERAKLAMNEYIPTDAIVPEGTRTRVALDPAENEYYRAGPEARARVKLGGDSLGNTGASRQRIHAVRTWTIDRSGVRVAPLERTVTIGDHFRLSDYVQCTDADYRSCMRTTSVFDLSTGGGDFTSVTLRHALGCVERWNDDGTLRREHRLLARDPHGHLTEAGLPARLAHDDGALLDMFLYRVDTRDGTRFELARYLGHMEYAALPDDAVTACGRSLHAALVRDMLSADDVRALDAGLRLVADVYAVSWNAADAARFAAGDVGPNGVVVGNDVGGPNILDSDDARKRILEDKALPFGLGSVSGLRTLAKLYDGSQPVGSAVRTAAEFARALEKYYDAVCCLVHPSHPAIQPDNCPAWARSSMTGSLGDRHNAINALGQNLLDHNKSPLHRSVEDDAIPAFDPATAPLKHGSEAEKQAFIAFVALVWRFLSPGARRVLMNEEEVVKLETKYVRSRLGHAYRDAHPDKDVRTFAGLVAVYTAGFVTESGATVGGAALPTRRGWANWLDRVLRGVVKRDNDGATFASDTIDTTFEAWSRDLSTERLDEAVDETKKTVITRLVVPYSVFAAATPAQRAGLAFASPFNVSQPLVDPSPENAAAIEASRRDSRRDVRATFVFTNASLSAATMVRSGATHHAMRGVARRERAYGRDVDEEYSEEDEPAFRRRAGAKRRRDEDEDDEYGDALAAAPPTFAASDFVDVGGGGTLVVNRQLEERYARAARDCKNALVRAAVQLVLLAPVHADTFDRFEQHDVRVPIDIIGERPDARFRTQSIIYACPGENGEMGAIAYMPMDAQMSNNATNKDVSVHVSQYFTCYILQPERYFIAEDVIVVGYDGGMGLRPHRAAAALAGDEDGGRALLPRGRDTTPGGASCYYFALPYGSLRGPNKVPVVHDLRGRFNPAFFEGRINAERLAGAAAPHYASAPYYNMLHMLFAKPSPSPAERDFLHAAAARENTLTFQGHQWLFKPSTGTLEHLILNRGHLGMNVYQGMANAFAQAGSAPFQDCHYLERYTPIDT